MNYLYKLILVGLIIILLIVGNIASAQELYSNGNTHKLLIDDSGSGFSNNSTRSQDQSNEYTLIGGFESYDIGYSSNTSGYIIKTGLQTTYESESPEISILSSSDNGVQLYSRLVLEIDPNSNPTSANGALFAIQISSDSFSNDIRYVNPTNFIPDNVTNSNLFVYYSPCAQTSNNPADDTRWDCGTVSGLVKYIKGLKPNTNYCVRAIALNGDATNSIPGPAVCATTTGLTLTLSMSATQTNFGSLSSTSYKTATPLITITTMSNANSGYTVYVKGTGNGNGTPSGLYSLSRDYLIPSVSGNLSSSIGTDGYGMQATITSGNAILDSNWDPSLGGRNSSYVGQINRNANQTLYSRSNPASVSDQAQISYLANISVAAPAANDYRDTITYTMIAIW
jgi:hypothetical protein